MSSSAPGGLDRPLVGPRPGEVGLRIVLHALDERRFVDTCHVEHHRRSLHLFERRLPGRGADSVGDVGVAGGVDHHPTEHCVAPGLRLDDHADDRAVLDDRGDDHGEQRLIPLATMSSATFLNPSASRAWLSLWGVGQRRRPLLELDADASESWVCSWRYQANPDPDLGDVAAEAAVTFEEKHRYPGAGGTDCGGEATGPEPTTSTSACASTSRCGRVR